MTDQARTKAQLLAYVHANLPNADPDATVLQSQAARNLIETLFAGIHPFNVKFYGAVGDGITDDTAAIQACITACIAAGGGVVYLPEGSYLITSTLTITALAVVGICSLSMVGDGAQATFIRVGSTTIDAIKSIPYGGGGTTGTELSGCFFRDFTIIYNTQATAGSALKFPWADRVTVDGVIIQQCFHALTIGQAGAVSTINEVMYRNVNVRSCAGNAIDLHGFGGNLFIKDSVFTGVGNTGTCTCIAWNSAYFDIVDFENLDFENFAIGIDLAVASGGSAAGLADAYMSKIFIDAVASGAAMNLAPVGNASASFGRVRFDTCVFISNGAGVNGVVIGAAASGVINDIIFSQCQFEAAGAGGTALVVGGNAVAAAIVKGITVDGCQVVSSPNGFTLTGCDDFTFINNTVGTPFGGGTGIGINFGGTTTSLSATFQNNVVRNYTTPYATIANLGAGSVVRNNPGINPIGTWAAPAVPATGVGVAADYVDRIFVITAAAGGATTVTITGTAGASALQTIPANTEKSILVPAGAVLTPTFGGGNAPTWNTVAN